MVRDELIDKLKPFFPRRFFSERRWQIGCAVDIVLEEVLKEIGEHSAKWDQEWRAGLKSNTHLEGKIDGADEIANAINNLRGR